MTDANLLPCPFCGGKAHFCQWIDTLDPNATWIECEQCHVATDTVHHDMPERAKQIVAATWNRRCATPNAGGAL